LNVGVKKEVDISIMTVENKTNM